ncbi:hypothetical protein H0H93_016470 [Arthromyces matolae]|nr:hypothetical protein H0H93_016470 [Arthromyces matolae]
MKNKSLGSESDLCNEVIAKNSREPVALQQIVSGPHKRTASNSHEPATAICDKVQDDEGPSLEEPVPLRPLTSLKWPYVPDESAFPDPLKRDDPKTLQLHQYEAIATSPAIRKIFEEHPELKTKIRSIDSLRGHDREEALQRALGVSFKDVTDISPRKELSEDTLALRELAEAIEGAVRKGQRQTIGLDWD